MIAHEDCGTLVPDSGTMVELESNLGTMVINSDSEDSTMKSLLSNTIVSFFFYYYFLFCLEHDTNPDKPKYRPPFLDHFDRKKIDNINSLATTQQQLDNSNATPSVTSTTPSNNVINHQSPNSPAVTPTAPSASLLPIVSNDEPQQRYQSHLQLQLNQISAANQMGIQHLMHGDNAAIMQPPRAQEIVSGGGGGVKYQRNFVDGEFEFVSHLYKFG